MKKKEIPPVLNITAEHMLMADEYYSDNCPIGIAYREAMGYNDKIVGEWGTSEAAGICLGSIIDRKLDIEILLTPAYFEHDYEKDLEKAKRCLNYKTIIRTLKLE